MLDLNFDAASLNKLTRIGPKDTYGMYLAKLMQDKQDVITIGADTLHLSNLDEAREKCSSQCLNVGIAEQNMLAIAAGLASEGFKVFANTYAAFATSRAYDQIKCLVGYMNINVKIVGLLSGFASGTLGATHYCLDDIALMSQIPNMSIVCPCDCIEIIKVLESAYSYDRPLYIRITGTNGLPILNKQDYKFEIGKARLIASAEDIAILAHGAILNECTRAMRGLARKGIGASLINFATINPLDTDMLDYVFDKFKYVFVVEEHYLTGGLYSAIANYAIQNKLTQSTLIPICVKKAYFNAASYAYNIDKSDLSATKLVAKIVDTLK